MRVRQRRVVLLEGGGEHEQQRPGVHAAAGPGGRVFDVVQRGAYLAAALGLLVGVPTFLKSEENRRIEEKKIKRERFLQAINGEIAELEAQNTPESLEMAADLRARLKELDEKLERERIAYEVW